MKPTEDYLIDFIKESVSEPNTILARLLSTGLSVEEVEYILKTLNDSHPELKDVIEQVLHAIKAEDEIEDELTKIEKEIASRVVK